VSCAQRHFTGDGNAMHVFENGVNSNSFVDLSGSERYAINIQRLNRFFQKSEKHKDKNFKMQSMSLIVLVCQYYVIL